MFIQKISMISFLFQNLKICEVNLTLEGRKMEQINSKNSDGNDFKFGMLTSCK